MSGRRVENILVTGATGQIGTELTMVLRKRYDGNKIVAVGHRRKPNDALLASGPFEYADLSDVQNVEHIVEKHKINVIYHLAAVLSATGEENPQLAWNTNMGALYNILETARKHDVRKVFFPSSIAVFGPAAPRVNTPQDTVLVPRTMYGVSKVAGELLCNYYSVRYGLDVRGLRYPGIISSEVLPSGGTTDYAVEIFYEAIRKRRYTCFVRKGTVLPMMYMPDCIKATVDLMETESSKVKRHDAYNVTAMSFSAEELANEIRKYIPEFECEYKPDSRQKIADSWPMSIDDTVARMDWGWKPSYDLKAMTKDMIDKLTRKLG
jgi:nucleoside-diphosphate-sugar epimerase